ncbi:MAG: glutamate-1-semialdehyde 2,1-aminomutase [Simkaniaceae bacterium]|nr:glutamate-1-semialdehyde 2,1-aminomutase [Simkaniaceae bacterium]
MERSISKKIFEKSQQVFPGGVNSPVRSFPGLGISPLVIKSGKGDMITDLDGYKYIDFCMSWGPLILGHSHPVVIKAIQEQIENGTTFGIATEEELLLGQWVIDHVASIEKVRFVSTGTEATGTAIRLARAFTKRSKIVKFDGNYHGSVDSLLIRAGSYLRNHIPEASSSGIPSEYIQSTVTLPYNDPMVFKDYFSKHGDEIAAVIVEPIAGNMGVVPASGEFLGTLRQLTIEKGALLIFDEVITGFRVGLDGAQGLYGIEPDLTCFGKIIGGGLPAAAIGGSREIMDFLAPKGDVFQAGTLSGCPVAMRAGLATLQCVSAPKFYEKLKQKADVITKPVHEFITKNKINACVQQVGSMFTLFFGAKSIKTSEDLNQLDAETFKRFFQYLFVKGIYFPPSQMEASFVSIAHEMAHLEKTRDEILKFLQGLLPQ